jgi:hypothetical protein
VKSSFAFGLLLGLALLGCAGAGRPAGKDSVEVLAPIVRVGLRGADSQPPRYFADVVSAVRDGCTRFSRFALRRDGERIVVAVYNLVPADRSLRCTMIYGEHTSAVPLGDDLRPGVAYTLDVNGTEQRFVAR